MEIKINKIVDKIRSYTERIKSIVLIILFCAVLVLSSLYIVMTYEETIDSGSMINVNSMIFMSDKSTVPNTLTDSMLKVTPSVIGYRYESQTKGIIGNKNIIDSIYSVFIEKISDYLGKNAECTVYSEHEGNSLLSKCLNSEKFVYFKFHNPWVSSMLRSYSDISTSSDLTEFADGEVMTVSEIILTYYLGQWRFIALDGNGTVAEYKIDAENDDFDISWLSAYNDNTAFIDFQFGINAAGDGVSYSYAPSAFLSENTVYAKYFSTGDPNNLAIIDKTIQDKFADQFYINLDRSGQFDSSDSKDYIDSHGTLSLSSGGQITYTSSEPDGGIDLSNYLGYENYGENYTIDDILRASARLLYNINSINGNILGGSAYASLNNVYVSDSNVVVEFGYYCDNIAIANEEGESVLAARMVCDGKRFQSITILSVTFIENNEKSPMLPQHWILDQMIASDISGLESKKLTVKPLYVLPKSDELSPDNSSIHAQWVFSAK